jgi:hypothetical protein
MFKQTGLWKLAVRTKSVDKGSSFPLQWAKLQVNVSNTPVELDWVILDAVFTLKKPE